MKIYEQKAKDYFSTARTDLISLIPQTSSYKVLEVGAGSGATLMALKKMGLASETTGIELFSLEDSYQTDPLIDHFIIGNIEQMEINLPSNHFDLIICADVLEHLIDPWAALKKIHPLLHKGGLLLVSIPNIREFSVFYKVFVKGDFQYAESGILDKTHLRFFCKKNVNELLQSTGFQVKNIYQNYKINQQGRKRKLINTLTLGIFRELLASQYLIVATKA